MPRDFVVNIPWLRVGLDYVAPQDTPTGGPGKGGDCLNLIQAILRVSSVRKPDAWNGWGA